jgi:hypothetical protein
MLVIPPDLVLIWGMFLDPKYHFFPCLWSTYLWLQLYYRAVEYSREEELFEVGGALFPEEPLANSLKGAPYSPLGAVGAP